MLTNASAKATIRAHSGISLPRAGRLIAAAVERFVVMLDGF
jgi:hypothetical protein